MRSRCRRACAVISILAVLSGWCYAESGVTDKEIVLGQSAVFEGPASALGLGMRAGLQAYFKQVNASGGIGGRTIRLIAKDDGYEPDKAIQNTTELIQTDQVLLLIGEVGTPTSQVAVPIAEEARVPFVAPFTGAEFLRNPFKKQVINLRASYFQEMERIAQWLVDTRKINRIACFYQNDGYGQAGLKGIELALARRQLELVSKGTYERNTTAVKTGLLDVRKGNPQAIVLVGTYKACAEFIKLAKRVGLKDAVFCNISFVGTKALHAELAEAGEGVVISQVVPSPAESNIPVVVEYQGAMKKYHPSLALDWISLEGFLAAKFFCQVAEKAGVPLTRDGFISTVEQVGTFDLGGFSLKFGPKDHQGSDQVYMTIIKGGQVVPLE